MPFDAEEGGEHMSWDVVQAYREGRAMARAGKALPEAVDVLARARRLGWLSRNAGKSSVHRTELASCLQWFVEERPSSPVLIAFSRTSMGLLDTPSKEALLTVWRQRMEQADVPARALFIAAYHVEPEDWDEAERFLMRAVATSQDSALCEAVVATLYVQPGNPNAPSAAQRLDRLGALRDAADEHLFAGIGMVMAKMALAQQRWAEAARWAEEVCSRADGKDVPGSDEIIGIAALAQGDMGKARQYLSRSAGFRAGESWKFRMRMQTTGMLYNAAWRNALTACLEHRPDIKGADGIRKNLLSWKQRAEQGTMPTRI